MDPKLTAALMRIANSTDNPQVRSEIAAYVQTGGKTPLSASTLTLVQPQLQAQGMTAMTPPVPSAPTAPGGAVGLSGAAIPRNPNAPAPMAGPSTPVAPTPGPGPDRLPMDPQNTNNMTGPPSPTGGMALPDPNDGNPRITPPMAGNSTPGDPLAGTTRVVANQYNNQPGNNSGVAPSPGFGAGAASAAADGGAAGGLANTSSGIPGGFSAVQETALQQDDMQLIRFALKSAGFDPDHLTPMAKLAARALTPLVQARRAAFGFAGGADGNSNGGAGLAQDIASFAKEFTTPGQNFYGHAKDYANSVVGGAGFQAAINAPGMDPEKVNALYASFMPLMYGGANPLTQAAAQSTYNTTQNQYNDADFNSDGQKGLFRDWIAQQDKYKNDPIVRSIYGMR